MPSLLFFHFLFYLGFAVLTISVMSALADIADEHELLTGRRQEGMFYAARVFFAQLSSGLGHLLAGICDRPDRVSEGREPGQVGEDVLFKLGLIDGPIASLPGDHRASSSTRATGSDKQRHARSSASSPRAADRS